ncbi:MAG: hypothetical protein OEV28_00580 [Nitrospirota bacterium]|nr:hypothetical protein [Nitrospirota bacterium]
MTGRILILMLVLACSALAAPANAMGRGDGPPSDVPMDEPGFLANGDFEGGLTGLGDSGYGIAMPWMPYVSTRLRYSGKAEFEVIYKPLGAIYSGRLAQRWYGDGPWRGGIYQAFKLPPGLYSIEVWYADPAARGLASSKRTNIRVGVYDGISGYEPPAVVRWSSPTTSVEPRWNRIFMSAVPLTGRAATLYIETWNDSAVPHNVAIDQVEVRLISLFGQPETPDQPENGNRKKDKKTPR